MKAGAIFSVILLAAAAIWWAAARDGAGHGILIADAAAKPLPDGGALIALTIENRGAPDRLIGVESPVATAALYSPVDPSGPPIPTGAAGLALDGAHIRLAGAEGEFENGALIPLRLIFEVAGEVAAKARLSAPAATGAAQSVGLFGLGDICVVGEGEPAPRVALSASRGEDGWKIAVDAEDFTFSEEYLGLYHVPGMGHGHLYVGGMKLGRLFTPEARIGRLPKGRHQVQVTLNTNDHRAYVVDGAPVTATVTIEVD